MKIIIGIFVFIVTFSLAAQEMSGTVKGSLGTNISSERSRLSAQYSFHKRLLEETDFMKSNREKRIVSDTAYISPDQIAFDLHTFGLRYKKSKNFTYQLGGSYLKSEVRLIGVRPTSFFTPPRAPRSVRIPIFSRVSDTYGSKGLGDTRVGFFYKAHQQGKHSAFINGQLNIPTGATDKQEGDYRFPYAGQLGSGTYDFMPELQYKYGKTGVISGAKLQYVLRTGKSNQNYRMGNQAIFDTYLGYDYKNWASFVFKGRVRDWAKTSDPRYEVLNPRIDDPYVQKGRRWEVLATVRTGLPLPLGLGAMIIEGGVPIYQGQKSGEVQLQTNWFLNTRLVASF